MNIDEFIRQILQQRAAALEKACEAALQTGKFGVMVKVGPGLDWSVSVSPSVPYGEIWEVVEL